MRALLLWSAALVVGGCGAEQADQGSVVAVVPTSSVTVQNVMNVTQIEPPQPEPSPEPQVVPPVSVKASDVGCGADDARCLERACAGGSGRGCEARGDLYQTTDDVRALDWYGHALATYRDGCHRNDQDACADMNRLATPGYKAHSYRSPPDCPDGYLMSPYGCLALVAPGAPAGTTVVVNGHHNVVQVFGSAAKVVGRSSKKTKKEDSPAGSP